MAQAQGHHCPGRSTKLHWHAPHKAIRAERCCNIPGLSAHGAHCLQKMDGSFRSFTSTQGKWSPAECQAQHQACENLRNTFQSPGLSPAHTESIQTEQAELAEALQCGFPGLGLAASSHQKPWGCSGFPQGLRGRQGRTQGLRAPSAPLPRHTPARGDKPQPGVMHHGPADLAG